MIQIEIEVNGRVYNQLVRTNETLLDVLRERLGFKGTKQSCENGHCGSCTVLLDGKPINACLMLAAQVGQKKNNNHRRLMLKRPPASDPGRVY